MLNLALGHSAETSQSRFCRYPKERYIYDDICCRQHPNPCVQAVLNSLLKPDVEMHGSRLADGPPAIVIY